MSRATGSPPVRSLACLLAIALLALGSGCTGELTLVDAPAGGGGGDGGGDGGGADAGGEESAGEAMFNAQIDSLFSATRPKGACVVCHQNGSPVDPDFLGTSPTTHYDSLVGDPAMVGATPEASLLYTKGDHPTGNAFCTGADTPYAGCTQDEMSLLAQWITLEAQ